jgi:hypothetical protein
MAHHLAGVLIPTLRDVTESDELREKLLAQPHAARVEISAIQKSVSDLYSLIHFMESPVAMFIQTHAPRLLKPLEPAMTVPEASEVFGTAREASALLFNLDPLANAALSYEISELAGTYYALYLASQNDPSLHGQLDSTFQSLRHAFSDASEIFVKKQDFQSLLNPSDALQNVTLSLLTNSEDMQTSASLLTLGSMDDRQRRELVEAYGQQLEKMLRNISGPLSEMEKAQLTHLFRLFAMGVLSVTDPENAVAVRQKLADFGQTLMNILNDDLSVQERQELCTKLRNLLRPLMSLVNLDGQEAVMNFVRSDGDPWKPKTYEVTFAMKLPDMTDVCNTLRKLAGVLHQYQVKFDTDK